MEIFEKIKATIKIELDQASFRRRAPDEALKAEQLRQAIKYAQHYNYNSVPGLERYSLEDLAAKNLPDLAAYTHLWMRGNQNHG